MMYPMVFFIAFPLTIVGLYFVGYAAVATIISGTAALITFIITGLKGITPMEYIIYGIGTLLILLWTLRENIKRLMNGTERLHGYRAKKNVVKQPKNKKVTSQQEKRRKKKANSFLFFIYSSIKKLQFNLKKKCII